MELVRFNEPKRKLNLAPMRPGRSTVGLPLDRCVVSISNKNSTMNIGKAAVNAMGMGAGWYKISFDLDNKVIAWQVRGELDGERLQEKGWSVCRLDKTGQMTISLGRILPLFKLKHPSYLKIEVQKYRDTSIVSNGEVYYYVDLRDAELNHSEN